MRTYQEASDAYVVEKLGDAYGKKKNLPSICVGLEDQPGIETVIPDIRDDYKNQVIVQENVLYYKYVGDKQRVQWCFEAGIPVWGYETYQAFVEDTQYAPITKGEYIEVGGLYVCAPDLTGFEPEHTYYVLYDENGTETIGNSLKVGAPENITDWYNYSESSKKWANVVTIGGDGNPNDLDNNRAYFVWIPRYVYKLDKDKQEADIKFVDKKNQYKEFNDSTNDATYSDLTPTYDDNGYQTNYCLPESFKWDGADISGFWVSKYEVSSVYGTDPGFECIFSITDTTISLCNLKVLNTSLGISSYEIFVNGESKGTANTISNTNPFTITGLTADTVYSIRVKGKNSSGIEVESYIEKVKTTEKSIAELTKPNLQGYEKDHTYYVTYDGSGNEIIGSKVEYDANGVPTNIPEGWYNYENKIWANIVTIGGDGNPNDLDNNKAYFVWIPRYEYKTKDNLQEIQIRFISSSQKTANESLGYKLPEGFKWDGTDIAGFWVSKYEVSSAYGTDPGFECEFSMTDTTISLCNLKVLNTGLGISSYEVCVNGESKGTANTISNTNPFTITGLTANTVYTIRVKGKNSSGIEVESYIEKVKTTEKSIAELTKPNLKGFDKDHTYYVTYDASGTEIIGSKVEYDANGVPTNIPSGWYNYENKIWANIVTIGGDGDPTKDTNTRAYFTWIPRYEYKTKKTWGNDIEVRYISTSQTEANTALGYKLPESFTWDNNNNGTVDSGESLAGYWVSKYEVSDIN